MGFFYIDMDLRQIINREVYHFMGEGNMDEDYPKSFDMEHFKSLTTFVARKRYAEEQLPKLGVGTGRRVYIIDDNTVLKLAANNKGLAQNKRESELSRVNWYSNIADVKDEHPQQLWIEAERAKKISKSRFKQLSGYSIEDVAAFATKRSIESIGHHKKYGSKEPILDKDVEEQMWEDPFTYNLAGMIGDYDQSAGDLDRISSYGEIVRDGKPEVVLLDYGLSNDVWGTHYDWRRNEKRTNRHGGMGIPHLKHPQHEGDSNYEDELTNFINPDEIKDGGYAFTAPLPTKELQGDDLVKEDLNAEFKNASDDVISKAVKYIENLHNLKDVSNVYNSYLISIQNVNRAVEMSMNVNKFYNNLMAIQTKLKGFGLIKEDLVYWHVDGDASPESDEYRIGAESMNEDGTSLYNTVHGSINTTDGNIDIQETEEKMPEKQKVGTLMAKFELPNWDFIINKIKPEDLYHPEDKTKGLEDEAHITVLFGFNETVLPEDIQTEIGDIDLPIKATIKGISLFNNPEFDVIKLDVDSPDLVELRKKVETLPNTLTYKDYTPHMTIAYVLRGRGQKYVYEFKSAIEIESTALVYSDSNRNQIELDFSPEIVEINEEILTTNRLSEIVKGMIDEQNELTLQNLPFRNDIERLGGKMYAVGGAVRDEFIGKESKDLDILITGVPMDKIEQIANRYGKVDAVGESFGVLKFIPNGTTDDVDIAIPRTEFATGDGGHKDFEVTSDHTLPIEKDLVRRDFTINALAKDIDGNVIDNHGGIDDIKSKIIRLVNPDAFGDDPLRMLRGVQFASRFGFTIEPETMKSIQQNASKINNIASDRILEEFNKIVTKGDALVGAQLLRETGLLKQIFGNDNLDTSLPWKNVESIADFVFLLAKDNVENPSEFYLKKLISDDAKKNDNAKEVRALNLAYKNVSNDIGRNRMLISNMYSLSKNSVNSRIIPKELHRALNDVIRGSYPKGLGDLAINGNDIKALGIQGKPVGNALNYLLFQVHNDKLRNDRDELLAAVQKNDNNVDNSIIFDEAYNIIEALYESTIIDDSYSLVESMLSEREIRYMPNAETVEVNKNCRLGGNADGTSDACNQGEMKNLTTKKIEEEEEEVNTKRPYYLRGKEPVRVNENIRWGDSQISKLENIWKDLDDETKQALQNIHFNLIDKRELSPQNSAIMNGLIQKHDGGKKENPDIVDVSKKLTYYSGLWKNIGDPAKRGTMTSLYNKAQNNGELSKREYDELDYFLKNGRTRYNSGELSKKYK